MGASPERDSIAARSPVSSRRSGRPDGDGPGTDDARKSAAMAAMDETVEARQRGDLADALDRNRDEIEGRWLRIVLAELQGRDVSPTELRDAMPDYLRELAESLRSGDGMEELASAAWAEVAREHAVTRVRLGFDIGELVHEFIVLRRVLIEVALEAGVLVEVRQAARLADLVEAAIAVSVKSYVESRDYEARRKEAEHVGFITHELRNPLTTATLAAGQLRRASLEQPPRAPPPRQLEILERALHRISALIDGVLAVERLGAGTVEAVPLDLPLLTVLEQPLAAAEALARAKGLTFEVKVPSDALVHVDPDLTSSAVFSVVENAVKYTDAGRVHVEAEEGETAVVLHVRDNCRGLSDEELRTIFEPFQRGHSQKPGTGLGLAIARRALETEGGALHAESTGDRGCHFWMTLPRALH